MEEEKKQETGTVPDRPGGGDEEKSSRRHSGGGSRRGRHSRGRRNRDGRKDGRRDSRSRSDNRRGERRDSRERYPRRDRGRSENRSSQPKELKREILVNTSFEETRVAVVENDRLVELLWERRNSKSIVGNIYKCRVENVLPGISSAFINIGFDKNAYLYISDVIGDGRKPIDKILKKGQEVMI